jgi:hypothetical protein
MPFDGIIYLNTGKVTSCTAPLPSPGLLAGFSDRDTRNPQIGTAARKLFVVHSEIPNIISLLKIQEAEGRDHTSPFASFQVSSALCNSNPKFHIFSATALLCFDLNPMSSPLELRPPMC